MRDELAATLAQSEDPRNPQRLTWELPAVLRSAFAMFFFPPPSLLEYQRRMKQQTGRANLERVFQVAAIPSATQMREIRDGVPTESLRRVVPQTFEQMRRGGWTARFVAEGAGEKDSPVVLAGSEYFHATQIHCPHCLPQRPANGETHYSQVVVSAPVTRAGSQAILPLDVEEGCNREAQDRQACELRAAQRLGKRLRAEPRQLAMGIGGDDLYGPEPLMAEVQRLRLRFVLVAQPSAQATLVAQVEEQEQRGECVRGTWTEGAGPRRRTFTSRSAAAVPLTQTGAVRVNFLAVWEQRPAGTVGSHNSWVTDLAVTPETVAAMVGIGRSRWKLEKEPFNVQKNHGYALEPNYGHGQPTLSRVFYLLNL